MIDCCLAITLSVAFFTFFCCLSFKFVVELIAVMNRSCLIFGSVSLCCWLIYPFEGQGWSTRTVLSIPPGLSYLEPFSTEKYDAGLLLDNGVQITSENIFIPCSVGRSHGSICVTLFGDFDVLPLVDGAYDSSRSSLKSRAIYCIC